MFNQRCETRNEKPEFSVLKAELTFFQGQLDLISFTWCQHSMCESTIRTREQQDFMAFSLPKTWSIHSRLCLQTGFLHLKPPLKSYQFAREIYSLKVGKCQTQRSTRLDHTPLLVFEILSGTPQRTPKDKKCEEKEEMMTDHCCTSH